jgi:hypothetical protein
MTYLDVIRFYGSVRDIAQATGVSYQAVYKWQETDTIPPVRQYHFETLTEGKLKADNGEDA